MKADIAKAQSSEEATVSQATGGHQQAEGAKESGWGGLRSAPVPIQSLRKEALAKVAETAAQSKPPPAPTSRQAKVGVDVVNSTGVESVEEATKAPPREESSAVPDAKKRGTSVAVLSSEEKATVEKEPGQLAGGQNRPAEDPVSSWGPETAAEEEGAHGARASVNAPDGQAEASAADVGLSEADVREAEAGEGASGTDGVETTESADTRGANSPPEPVTLAQIVGGVEASQPFGHGEATTQEENVASPKMNLASAFPAAAAPHFKPHAEVDSVVDLVPSGGGGDVGTSGLDLGSRGDDFIVKREESETESGHLEATGGREEEQGRKSREGNMEVPSREQFSVVLPAAEAALAILEKPIAQFVASVPDKADELQGGAKDADGRTRSHAEGSKSEAANGGDAEELARLREELKSMEVALQHAAKQAQVRAGPANFFEKVNRAVWVIEVVEGILKVMLGAEKGHYRPSRRDLQT